MRVDWVVGGAPKEHKATEDNHKSSSAHLLAVVSAAWGGCPSRAGLPGWPRTQDLLQREVSVYEFLEQIGWSGSTHPEPGGISEMWNLLLQFASQTEQWKKGNIFQRFLKDLKSHRTEFHLDQRRRICCGLTILNIMETNGQFSWQRKLPN